MDTFEEMQTSLKSDLNVSGNSSLFPPATLKLALNRANIKIGGLFRWPQLEDAKSTTSQTGIEYYDSPTTWYPDSLWRLEVDGVMWGEEPDGNPMDYHDYLNWRADTDNASSTDKKWAVQWMRYFIYPVPTNSTAVIDIWGQKNVTTLTNNSDTTIFSYNMPECNEAIILEAGEILKSKGEDEKAKKNDQLLSPKALGILTNAFNKIKRESGKYEKTEAFLNVPDFFGRSNSNNLIGRF